MDRCLVESSEALKVGGQIGKLFILSTPTVHAVDNVLRLLAHDMPSFQVTAYGFAEDVDVQSRDLALGQAQCRAPMHPPRPESRLADVLAILKLVVIVGDEALPRQGVLHNARDHEVHGERLLPEVKERISTREPMH